MLTSSLIKAAVTAVAVTTTIKLSSLLPPLRFWDGKEDRLNELPWDGKGDRISELPRDIIYCIFDRVQIRDVARTSILSRKWRHICALYPQLVFDENFFKEICIKQQPPIRCEFPKAINNTLLVCDDPTFKFILHIPIIVDGVCPEIDQWILFLSSNEIRELELYSLDPTSYIEPSCVFSCSLLYLELRNCVLKTPDVFNGFHLVSLKLVKVSISASMFATLLENAPVLKKLVIIRCSAVEHRSICAPRLEFFCIIKSGKVDWQWFASNKKLESMQVLLGKEIKNVEQTVDMMKFLKDIPKVKRLCLDGFSLKHLAITNPYEFPHENLIHSAPLLTKVLIHEFGVDDLDQISSALCLLRNCPNLMILELEIASLLKNNVIEAVREYLEPSNYMDMRLDKLQMVNIKSMIGIEAELLFIKLLLARSSFLERMVIEQSSGIVGCNISQEILQFHQASSELEIIYKIAK